MVSWRDDGLRYLALSTGVMVSAFGAAVLFAWYVHFVPLIQIAPGLPPLTRQSALAHLLSGAALALLAAGRKRAAAACAAIPLVLAVVVCFEYILDRDLGVDQLLGRAYISAGAAPPGRMAPVIAFWFLGSSLALLAMSIPRLARYASAIAGVIGSVLIAVSSVTFLAYVVGRTSAYGWGHFKRVSIHGAAASVLLGLGILALAAQESRLRKTLPKWLPLGIGLGLTAGALGLWQALMAHEASELPLLSHLILAAGILGASLVAVTVYLAQKAMLRSRQWQEGKEAYERLFEASLDALLVTDRDGRIVGANQRVKDLLGYMPEELLGQPIETLVPEDLRDIHRKHHQDYNLHPEVRLVRPGLDLKGRRKDGSEFSVDISLSPLRSRGELQVLAAVRDITERRHAEEALRQSEERFRGVFETSLLGLALIGPDYRLAKVNASLCRMSGYSEAELMQLSPFDLTHPDDREKSKALAGRLFKGEIPSYQEEKRYVKKSGEIMWATMTATIVRDQEGRTLFGLGMVEDITERKQAQEALRQSEERFRGVFEQGPIGVTLMGRDYRLVKVNAALCRMLGYSEAELLGMTPLDFTYPGDREPTIDLVEHLFETETPMHKMEKRYVKKSGEVIWGSVTASVIHDLQGKPLYGMGMIEDITERKRAEDELRTVSQRLSQAVRFASMSVWEWDPRTNCFVWDDTAFELIGIPKVVPLPYEQFARVVHPDDLNGTEAGLRNVVLKKTQESLEFRVIRPDGGLLHVYAAGGPVLDQQGNVARVVGIAVDMTERKRVEDELRALSERLSLATRIASIGVWDWNLRTNLEVWDDASFEMFGMSKVNPLRHEEFVAHIHPDDLAKVGAATERVIGRQTQETVEFRIVRTDGSVRYLSVAAGAVPDEKGNVIRMLGIAIDITERKRLEADLEAAREQAITSARLSALGMMAGGIAHEINNPLSIIHAMASDLAEMVAEEGSAPPPVVARKSAIIRETAERIARIVRSLRQISREGSSDLFHPTPLAKILAETLEICRAKFQANSVDLLLPRAIPELSIPCREVQIAQALLNLLQNAFDAVAEQEGERWVRLEVAPRDTSVAISVIDSGPGVPSELRSRIGEPFFTTKPVGKGTGLGLSLSKTIAEDHGGRLEYGEDCGHTRFSLILPLARKAEAA